jgi:hypothetical protein
MAKLHNYMKYIKEPKQVVALHLSDDVSETSTELQSIGCWQKIGTMLETVSQLLESSRPGSKFPLFHRIGGEIPISRLEVSLFENELKSIKTELKKLPVSETRMVRFTRKGKAEITKIDEKKLATHKGVYVLDEDKDASNLYESFRPVVDMHNKLCRQAKKKDIGLTWRNLEKKELVAQKPKAKTQKLKAMSMGASSSN